MPNTLMQIHNMYDTFGRGERKLADWILKNTSELISLSISDLAAACGCGEATVVRFSKRLGFSGYQALKIHIAKEAGTNLTGSLAFTPEDTALEIYSKHISDIAITLEKTKNFLDSEILKTVAETLLHARAIHVLGLGNSAPVAMDAAHKLSRAGLPAYAYSDNHMQMIVTSHLGPEDVVLAISHSGSSTDIINALELAQHNGAITVCITNHGKSPIVRYSDHCLFTNAEETKYSILAMTSRIAQLAIIDTLYTYIVLHGGEQVSRAIEATEAALERRKF